MKLLDVNILVPAQHEDHPLHGTIAPWLDALLGRGEPFAVPDLVAGSFLRIVTSRRVFDVPTPTAVAFAYLRELRATPGHVAIGAGPDHLDVLERVCVAADATGDLVPDAQLAALATEFGAEIVSFDRDFARFDVRWSRPVD